MNKNVLTLTVGLIIGGVLFVMLEGLLMYRFEVDNPSKLSFMGLLFLIGIHAFGSFFTGFFIGILRRVKAQKLSFVAALIFTSTAMITVLIDMYPTWFVFCDILIFVPFALIGSVINFTRRTREDVDSDRNHSVEL